MLFRSGLIAREEILRSAQAKSVDIINQAHLKSREIKKAAAEYADETMKRTDEILQQSITAQREIYKHIDESVSQVLAENREVCKKAEELMGQNVTKLRKARQVLRNPPKNDQ